MRKLMKLTARGSKTMRRTTKELTGGGNPFALGLQRGVNSASPAP